MPKYSSDRYIQHPNIVNHLLAHPNTLNDGKFELVEEKIVIIGRF